METLTSAHWFPCPGQWPWWCRHGPPTCSSEVRAEPEERDRQSVLMPLPGRWPGRNSAHLAHMDRHTQQGCPHLSTNFHSQSTSQPLSHLLHTAPGRNRASTHIPIFKFHLYIPSCTGSRCCMWAFSSCGEWWGHSLVVVGGLLTVVACGLNSCAAQA